MSTNTSKNDSYSCIMYVTGLICFGTLTLSTQIHSIIYHNSQLCLNTQYTIHISLLMILQPLIMSTITVNTIKATNFINKCKS